jgi:hypothetical protein
MPEGLLDGLADIQLRDLFGYLRSTQPLNDGREEGDGWMDEGLKRRLAH